MSIQNGKKKILIITRAHSQNAGGMERLSFELHEALVKEGSFDVELIAHTGSRTTSPLFNIVALQRVWRAAKKADIVHIGDPLLSFLGFIVKTHAQKKVSIMVHGLDIAYQNYFYQMYLHAFFRVFDLYLPISNHVRQLLTTHQVTGHIQTIHPGIKDEWYDPSVTRNELARLIHRDANAYMVLHTNGRLTPRKGQAWFVTNVLPKLPTNVIYVISGTGQDKTTIETAAHKAGVTNRVILLGRVSTTDLKILYNSVDAFIQPNIPLAGDVEGFGLVLLEAATCARPIFAAKTEGIQDAIQDGKNGRLLPAGDAAHWISTLNDWVKNGQYANKTSAVLARTYTLDRFSWDKVIKNYISAWSELS